MSLYPATILEIGERDARVAYDDTAEARVPLEELEPFVLRPGMALWSRKGGGRFYTPARVTEVRDDKVRVAFESGETEWTTTAALRLGRPQGGSWATSARWRPDFSESVAVGSRVLAP